MSQNKVLVSPPRGGYKGGSDIILTYPKQVPDSPTYTVTFKSDTGGRAVSSKVDAQKIDDKSLSVTLPRHGRRDKVRVSVFGERPLHLPSADFEFIGIGRLLLNQLPLPVSPAQIIGIMLIIPDEEIRCDSATFDMELMATIASNSEGLPSLTISDMLEGTRLSARDDKENILHLCGEFGLLNLATYILDTPALFPSIAANLVTSNRKDHTPSDVAMEFDDLELHQLFVAHGGTTSHGGQGAEKPPPAEDRRSVTMPLTKRPTALTANSLFGRIGNKIRTGSGSGEADEQRSRSATTGGRQSVDAASPGNTFSLGRSVPASASMEAFAQDDQDGQTSEQIVAEEGSSSPATRQKKKKLDILRHRFKGKDQSKGAEQVADVNASSPQVEHTPLSPTSPVGSQSQTPDVWSLLQQVEGYGKVKLAYEPSPFDEGRLRLQTGDVMYIIERKDSGIWTGLLNKKKYGSFPMVYITEITQEEAEQLLADSNSGSGASVESARMTGRPAAVVPSTGPPGRPSPATERRANIQNMPLPMAPGTMSPSTTQSSISSSRSHGSRVGVPAPIRTTSSPPEMIAPMASDDEDLYTKVQSDDEVERKVRITDDDFDSDPEPYDEIEEPAALTRSPVHAMQHRQSNTSAVSANPFKAAGQVTSPSRRFKPPSAPSPTRTPMHQELEQQQQQRQQQQEEEQQQPKQQPKQQQSKQQPKQQQQQQQQQQQPQLPAIAPHSSRGKPPPPVQPPPVEVQDIQEDENTKGFYQVLYQADITSDYNPNQSVEMMDYLPVKTGEFVNVLCEPSDEEWALVEKSGKIGRVYVEYFRPRAEHVPYTRAKPLYLNRKLRHIDCILPGDQLGVCVDRVTQELVIFQVDKERGGDMPPPPLEEIGLPPPPEEPELYEYMAGEQEQEEEIPVHTSAPANKFLPHMKSSVSSPPSQPSQPASYLQPASEHQVTPPVAAKSSPAVSRKPAAGSPAVAHKHKPPPPAAHKKPIVGSPASSPIIGGGGKSKISNLKAQLSSGNSPIRPPMMGSPSSSGRPAPPTRHDSPRMGFPRNPPGQR